MASAWRRFTAVNRSLFPQFESLKQGRLAKVYYLYLDYKNVGLVFLKFVRRQPVKAAFRISSVGALFYTFAQNPNYESYQTQLIDSYNELGLVSHRIRNKVTNGKIRRLADLENQGRLKHVDLIFCSLIISCTFGESYDSFERHCRQTQPRWKDFKDRVEDVGVLGKWYNLDKIMQDYDVNDEEFTQTNAS